MGGCGCATASLFYDGDNRDTESDSRMWGMVPDQNLIEKATVWLSFDSKRFTIRWDRIGNRLAQMTTERIEKDIGYTFHDVTRTSVDP